VSNRNRLTKASREAREARIKRLKKAFKNGKGITICPPAYSTGYGFEKPKLEGL
tara:strand:- start:1243 stop:1404 length:162 start_codon:yes stop_codon:yes gene_type:complete